MRRVHREMFLFVAGAIYACHAEHQKKDARHEPAPEPPGLDVPEPEASPPDDHGAGRPDAAPVDAALDDGSAPPANPSADAGTAPASRPVATLVELRRRCRALAANAPDCAGQNPRSKMCQTLLAEFVPATADRAITCFESLDSPCDLCGVRTCTLRAVFGLERKSLPECAAAASAAEKHYEGYGEQLRELCETHAVGMTPRGRARFARCLRDNAGVGLRFCLWDPSSTPCTENARDPQLHDPTRPPFP